MIGIVVGHFFCVCIYVYVCNIYIYIHTLVRASAPVRVRVRARARTHALIVKAALLLSRSSTGDLIAYVNTDSNSFVLHCPD